VSPGTEEQRLMRQDGVRPGYFYQETETGSNRGAVYDHVNGWEGGYVLCPHGRCGTVSGDNLFF